MVKFTFTVFVIGRYRDASSRSHEVSSSSSSSSSSTTSFHHYEECQRNHKSGNCQCSLTSFYLKPIPRDMKMLNAEVPQPEGTGDGL